MKGIIVKVWMLWFIAGTISALVPLGRSDHQSSLFALQHAADDRLN